MSEEIKNEFEQGRLKHSLFRSKLRAILLGAETNEEPVLSEHECGFGKWMQAFLLKKFAGMAELKELEEIHTEMHRLARIVVKNYHAGSRESTEAEQEKIDHYGARILELLQILEESN